VIVVITGSSSGIGREVAAALQAGGHQIVHVGRDPSRYAEVLAGDDEFVECELSSLASVATAAGVVRRISTHIDLLINNAGGGGRRGQTVDGFELAFGVNYLSHYLLTRLLVTPSRVVNVSSEAHRPVDDLRPEKGLGSTTSLLGLREYRFSKAAQIAFTCALAQRGLRAFACHPGVIATDGWRNVPWPVRPLLTRRMQPPAAGAIPVLRAATDSELSPGDYVTPRGVSTPNPVTTDPQNVERLWSQSEEWVAPYLPL